MKMHRSRTLHFCQNFMAMLISVPDSTKATRYGPSSVFTFLSYTDLYNTTHLSSGDWEWKIFECINDEKEKKPLISPSFSADDGLPFIAGRKKISITENRVVVTAMLRMRSLQR